MICFTGSVPTGLKVAVACAERQIACLLELGELRGILGGDTAPALVILGLVEYWREGRFPFDRILRFCLFAEIACAFADAHSGAAIKPVPLMEELQ